MSSFIFPLESVKTGTFELEEVVSTKISVKFKKGIVVVSVKVEEVVDDVVIDRVQKNSLHLNFVQLTLKSTSK